MMKGALVELVSPTGGATPNVVVFQFNPETIRHSLGQPAAPGGASGQAGGNALAVSGAPTESFSFTLAMEITDQAPDPALEVGIYPRLAALEMLMHPTAARNQPTGGTGTTGGGRSRGRAARPALLPTVLFVWGVGRIVPVRVTSLTITEKLYDRDLNPTHAEAQIELRVLTPEDLRSVTGTLGAFASAAYEYTQGRRIAGAAANLGESARTIIGILGRNHLIP